MSLVYHPLKTYCALLEGENLLVSDLPAGLDQTREVALVSCDSQQVVPGTLFICKGAHFRVEYLAQAAHRGAFAYVSAQPYPEVALPCILVSDLRRAMARLAVLYYNDPSARLKVIGITGTKGKSSTAYYMKHILDRHMAPRRCGVVSSIDTYDGVEEFESHLTTPEPLELQRHFHNALESGLEYLVMEASSQALKYHRTLGVKFAAACFLNIGRDHISPVEHPDFEDYFRSKLKIFAQAELSCVNLDCDHAGEALAAAGKCAGRVLAFSRKDPSAQVYCSRVTKEGGDTLFTVSAGALSGEYRLTMPGLFNVENALAAITLCLGLNIPKAAVLAGLEEARVPGRMEVYTSKNGDVRAIVDYAHNRLSFETLFRSVAEEYPGLPIVTVFGCPGKKAYERRRDLGQVAGESSALVILTEEDSGEEDTLSICREISGYVKCPWVIEPNRGEAIRRAVLGCDGPTVILITGKGAEKRQKRGLEYIDTPSDVDYVQAFLGEYDLRVGS